MTGYDVALKALYFHDGKLLGQFSQDVSQPSDEYLAWKRLHQSTHFLQVKIN